MMTFVFIFYMATNMVPGNVDKFKVEAQNPDDKTDTIILDFNRNKDGRWKVVPRNKKDDVMLFKFDKQGNFMMQNGTEGKENTYPLLSKLKMEKNHKKWRKVTQVTFKDAKSDGADGKKVVFNIVKKGKSKRTIKVDESQSPDIGAIPEMTVIWK